MSGKKRKSALAAAVCLLIVFAVCVSSCSAPLAQAKTYDMMKGVSARSASDRAADGRFIGSASDMYVSLFKRSVDGEKNALISPLSVMLALAMTANGAAGSTLAQMEKVLGNDIPLPELNEYLLTYTEQLQSGEEAAFKTANSIWFRDDESLKVEQDFLQTNADYYGADAYKAEFDAAAAGEINSWVKKNTDGMIEKIVDSIGADTVMFLINAITFDAKWERVYNKEDVRKGEFHAPGGKREVDFMHSDESAYLDDGSATGFIKPYTGGDYSFVALLPNEGIEIGEYIAQMTGQSFLETLSAAQNTAVSALLPKFSYNFTLNMNGILAEMGMPDAFSGDLADFSKLGTSAMGNIFISEVLHKTFISVDELGTKAGAVTKVEMQALGMLESKTVVLDRPFVYAIVDNATDLPVFVGAVVDPLSD